MFIKLEEKGYISQGNLKLLKELLSAIQREPLVKEFDTFLRDNETGSLDFQREDTKPIAQTADTQHSSYCDVTASSERSSAAVNREMTRAMQDPDGETTSVQHHIDNHCLRRAQYVNIFQQEKRLQEQEVQGQAQEGTGSPPSKRRKCSSSANEMQEQKCPEIVLECEERLKSYYSNLSHILPFPWWDGTNRLKLENVYTELELQTNEGNRRDFTTQEIFYSKDNKEIQINPKRVLIEGDPGYGKSTFCKKLAYDWAKGDTEYFSHLKLLFCFELKDLLECDGKNILDAIFYQLSWHVRQEAKRQELWHFIQDNQTKVCFVFDGLDEVPTKNLPEYFKEIVQLKKRLLPFCQVIVTSRKIRDINSKQMYDTQLLIKGFDSERGKAFVDKYMGEMNAQGDYLTEVNSSNFMKEVEMSSHKDVLFNFMQSPLNTLMLCDIWIRANKLPNTITKLYEEIINYIVRRYKENNKCNEHFDEEIKQALHLLGEKSYLSLTKCDGNNYFTENDISSIPYVCELGLLTKLSGPPPTCRYDFYHLTFKEYFAAMYLAELLTIDRPKFVDEIDFSGRTEDLQYDETLFAFIGGRLQDNVGEIFKVWREKHFSPHLFFDPRPILYESCCRSTEVFENCAQFLPRDLIVNINTMVCQFESNRLNVNTTVLQCSNLRSEDVHFILSVSNVDTIDMYKKCYDALQKNPKSVRTAITINADLDEYQTKWGHYVQNFTFLEKANYDFCSDLNQITVDNITLKISNHKKSCNHYVKNILKSIFSLSSNKLVVEGLPLINLDFISYVLGCLNNITPSKSADMTFCDDSLKSWQTGKLKIKANFGRFKTCYKINDKSFDIIGLQNLLSKFVSDNHYTVPLDIEINCDCTDVSGITFLLKRLELVHIGEISFYIEQSGSLSKKNMCLNISSIVEALSLVSANKLVIDLLPYADFHFIRKVHTVLQNKTLLKYVDITFCDDSIESYQTGKLEIRANFGKFKTTYEINEKNFDFVGLQNLLSEFASANNERVSFDIEINCDCEDMTNITVLLQRLESVHIGEILLYLEQSSSLSNEDLYSNITSILGALWLVSANKLVMEGLPHANLDFIREVHTVLQSNKLFKSVDMTFCDDSLKSWQTCKLEITANYGKFKTCYKIDDQNFDIVGLQNLLSEFVSANNERVSLDIEINFNNTETLVNSDIHEMIRRLESVNIGEIVLTILNLPGADTDSFKQVSSIAQRLLQLSANRLFLRGLPQGSFQSLEDAIKCLYVSLPLKSVEMLCWNGEMQVMGNDEDWDPDLRQLQLLRFIDKSTTEKSLIIVKCRRFSIIISKNECSNVNIRSIYNLLSKYAAISDEKVSVEVHTEVDFHKANVESYINDTLAMITSVFVDKMTILVCNYEEYDEKDISEFISSVVKYLPKHSINKIVINGLPLVGNLKFMKDVHCCLADDNLLKSVEFTFLEDLELDREGKLEVIAKFGKFKTCYKMNSMNFNIMSLHQSLAEFVPFDNGSITMVIQVNCDLEESTGKDIEGVLAKSGSVDIEKVILHIRNNRSLNTEHIRSCTSDIIQSLSQVSAKESVIQGLPSEDFELIKTVHSQLVTSVPNKLTHMSFQPQCSGSCKLTPSEHSAIVVKSQKHTIEFGICKSKFDIISLYQELQKNLSTVKERTVIDANIKSTSNIKDDIQYILANSKDIMFHNVEYVGTSDELLPAIDVLESLAEVNAQQFSYKSNKSLQCKFMKSVCNAMLQCQSAQTVVISSTERCEDIEISVSIEQLVSDGLIIHGVKFKDKTAIIQGSYAKGEKTASKTIEVEFALNYTSNIDSNYDDVEVNNAVLDDSNALTKMYIKVCSALKTHKTSELKSLCIELPDIFLDEFCTCYSREFLIENVKVCIIALPCLAKVTIVGGKIISTDNSSETWRELLTKESLEMLEFKDCDLHESCQSVIIDSVNKADECRSSQLRITLCDSLSSQNVDLMKEKLLADGFVLSDTAGSASQGDIVFSLKGKSVSIVAISCKETNKVK